MKELGELEVSALKGADAILVESYLNALSQ